MNYSTPFWIRSFIHTVKSYRDYFHHRTMRTLKMKTSIQSLLFAIALLLIFTNCNEDEIVINDTADFEEYLEEEMEYQHIPALSVVIFKGDNILYENYSGTSHIEQGIPLESDHLFRGHRYSTSPAL